MDEPIVGSFAGHPLKSVAKTFACDKMHSPMAKLYQLASHRGLPASQSASLRPGSPLARHWDLLVLLLFVLASTPAVWLSPRSLVVVRDTSLIDDNWHLDEVFKLSRGIWVGRDVAFTHGPIFQWLSGVPARSMGVSMGAIYATWFTVPVWCAFVFVYLTLRLLLPEQAAWKRALLLFLVLVFWEPSLRNAFPVLLFAIFLRGWYAVLQERTKTHVLGIVAALLCVIGFLIASDTGVYSTAAWVVGGAAILFEARGNKRIVGQAVGTLLAYVVSGCVFALAVNAAIGRAFDFRFWNDSAQMVSVYRWATPAAMTDAGTLRLLGTLVRRRGGVPLSRRYRGQAETHADGTHRFPAGRFCFLGGHAAERPGSFRLRTRRDRVFCHGAPSRYDSFLVFRSGGFPVAAVLVGDRSSFLLSRPAFRPSTVMHLVQQVRHPLTQCPAGFPNLTAAASLRNSPPCFSQLADLPRRAQRVARTNCGLPLPDEVRHRLAARGRRRTNAGLHCQRAVFVAS